MGLISRQKLEKRTEKNGMFLLKYRKERNVPNGKERGAQKVTLIKITTFFFVSLPIVSLLYN